MKPQERPKWTLFSAAGLVTLLVTGCGGPTDARLHSDFATIYKGCKLDSAAGGGNDYGLIDLWPKDVWIKLQFHCGSENQVD